MWCDKVGAGFFKFCYYLCKFLGLLPFEYDFKANHFQTSRRATLVSCVICVLVAVVSPFVVKLNSEIYLVSGVHIDDNLSLVTSAQFCFGYAASFVVLLCQLLKRHNLCHMARNFQKVLTILSAEMGHEHNNGGKDKAKGRANIITPEIMLFIAIKFSITVYEVLINFPYLIQYGDFIGTEWFVAFFLNLYIAEIAAVFSDIVFAAMLLLARYFYLANDILRTLQLFIQADDNDNDDDGLSHCQMEIRDCRRKLIRVLRMYRKLRQMVFEFARCIEVSILVQMLNTFANVLTNLYALLDFYVQDNHLTIQDLVYTLMIFMNICLVLFAAERVRHSTERLRDTLLDLDASRGDANSGWRSDVLAFKVWPEVFEVNVLGMFPLNNTFLLFLMAYAVNFVVIILQFIITKALFMDF